MKAVKCSDRTDALMAVHQDAVLKKGKPNTRNFVQGLVLQFLKKHKLNGTDTMLCGVALQRGDDADRTASKAWIMADRLVKSLDFALANVSPSRVS